MMLKLGLGVGLLLALQACPPCPPGMDGKIPNCHCKPGHVPLEPEDPQRLKGCIPGPSPTPSPVPTATPAPSPQPTATPSPTPAPTPSPSPSAGACRLAAMPECGKPESQPGVYGCCITDKARPLPESPFNDLVDGIQTEIERELPGIFDRDGRVDEDVYMAEMVKRLRARGVCASRGGPSDEVGLKLDNSESWQMDVHLGNGQPRRSGYVAYCKPARFD